MRARGQRWRRGELEELWAGWTLRHCRVTFLLDLCGVAHLALAVTATVLRETRVFSGLNCGMVPNKSTPDPRVAVATECRNLRWATQPAYPRHLFAFRASHRRAKGGEQTGPLGPPSPRDFSSVGPRCRGRIFGRSEILANPSKATRQIAIRFFISTRSPPHPPVLQIEPVDSGNKNKVQGLDRSGKSDLDPWLMWCVPNYRSHGPKARARRRGRNIS